ncbi:Sperm-associated antigen 7-like protein [Frankliniella fusca]|uniref:Sperm-associated antigen 7-like protein n=1 Tax=Frankliniella fusca TaxID=407009 RepID=A0AAE1H1U9_9NEOP|nr:Sperm-associated antigen 7-like protein [Frankliniella fusca]
MDLLGSILNSMDKPPTVNSQRNSLLKKQREEIQRKQKEERARLQAFRNEIEQKINKFIQDDSQHKFKFDPMDKVSRSIVHDVAEIAGLAAFSFGEEEVDRAVTLFKKECAPCDEELAALRRGEEWDPIKAQAEAERREKELQEEKEASRKRKSEVVPATNYQEKYHHLIGKEAALDAARVTQTNKQYGFVPSANKKDLRSIEQTLADIQSKKRQKLNHPDEASSSSSAPADTTGSGN